MGRTKLYDTYIFKIVIKLCSCYIYIGIKILSFEFRLLLTQVAPYYSFYHDLYDMVVIITYVAIFGDFTLCMALCVDF